MDRNIPRPFRDGHPHWKHTESWRLNRCKDDQVAWNQRLHALPQHYNRSLVYRAHIIGTGFSTNGACPLPLYCDFWTSRLLGAENFDEWFFELTSVILAGEDLTKMATYCAQVETATSMKGLCRAYKVLLNDCKRIRQHQAEAAALPAGSPPLPPLTLDAHPPLGPELTGWLADNRSTDEAIAKSIRKHVDELIKLEKTAIAR
ncbi:hypothetical protein DYB31_012602, partial [Aphanomyces astaci]